MANWHGSARSNYVRVKDREIFMDWAQSLPDVEVVEQEGTFALLATSVSRVNLDGRVASIKMVRDHAAFGSCCS
jgi:hypothetical protein